ncbi:MAG TPA: Crp/Fnr family transcriptional regulator [Bacteroidales bacterium]|nr:Crp/Fnr family transcriptional regulator [Bacteroidales bacterium]
MLDQLTERLKKDSKDWEKFQNVFMEKEIASKTILLNEGEVSTKLHFIKKGCLRLWFNKEGKDITVQFFFEGQVVSSIDSLMSNQPSMFTIESIEPCTIISLKKNDLEQIFLTHPELKEGFNEVLFQRFKNYAYLFLSRIRDTPQERYADLLKNHPEIIKRVPQHYIASYLGITAISLSRIRNRKIFY